VCCLNMSWRLAPPQHAVYAPRPPAPRRLISLSLGYYQAMPSLRAHGRQLSYTSCGQTRARSHSLSHTHTQTRLLSSTLTATSLSIGNLKNKNTKIQESLLSTAPSCLSPGTTDVRIVPYVVFSFRERLENGELLGLVSHDHLREYILVRKHILHTLEWSRVAESPTRTQSNREHIIHTLEMVRHVSQHHLRPCAIQPQSNTHLLAISDTSILHQKAPAVHLRDTCIHQRYINKSDTSILYQEAPAVHMRVHAPAESGRFRGNF